MVAIKVKQEIKDKNPHLSWVQATEVNKIVKRANYPNRFWVNERVIGVYADRVDLHKLDGWRPYLNLVDGVDYDSSTQRLNTNLIVGYPIGENLANTTHYAYKIVDLTEAQIENNNNESAREQVSRYLEDGSLIVEEFRLRAFRRIKNKDLLRTDIGKMDRWFQDIYNSLLVGNFREARRLVNNEIISRWEGVFDDGEGNTIEGDGSLNKPAMRFIANKFHEDINEYFDTQYEM